MWTRGSLIGTASRLWATWFYSRLGQKLFYSANSPNRTRDPLRFIFNEKAHHHMWLFMSVAWQEYWPHTLL